MAPLCWVEVVQDTISPMMWFPLDCVVFKKSVLVIIGLRNRRYDLLNILYDTCSICTAGETSMTTEHSWCFSTHRQMSDFSDLCTFKGRKWIFEEEISPVSAEAASLEVKRGCSLLLTDLSWICVSPEEWRCFQLQCEHDPRGSLL